MGCQTSIWMLIIRACVVQDGFAQTKAASLTAALQNLGTAKVGHRPEKLPDPSLACRRDKLERAAKLLDDGPVDLPRNWRR
jgi:hypothetical protein